MRIITILIMGLQVFLQQHYAMISYHTDSTNYSITIIDDVFTDSLSEVLFYTDNGIMKAKSVYSDYEETGFWMIVLDYDTLVSLFMMDSFVVKVQSIVKVQSNRTTDVFEVDKESNTILYTMCACVLSAVMYSDKSSVSFLDSSLLPEANNILPSSENREIMSNYSFQSDYDSIEVAANSVFYVDIYNNTDECVGSASGFVAFQEHLFITNYHVIKDASYLVVWDENDNYYILDQIAILDEMNDLAIVLFPDGDKYRSLAYELNAPLKRGQPVTTIGSPKGLKNTVAFGNISAFPKLNGKEMIQFTAPISHGSSGGVLFSDNGKVIGITTAILSEGENLGFAVPVDELFRLYSGWDKKSYIAMDNNFSIRNGICLGDTFIDVLNKETLPEIKEINSLNVEWRVFGKGTIWGIEGCEIHYHFNRWKQLDKVLIVFTSSSEDALSRLDKAKRAKDYLHNHFGKVITASSENKKTLWVATQYAEDEIHACMIKGGKDSGINGTEIWEITGENQKIYIDCVSYYLQKEKAAKKTYHFVMGFYWQ